ncbi:MULTISPECIES: 50S ribosomal protein L29 [Thermodesulfovibrio]|uniref:Large ribosomal subunit protein uL29 n=2 Tax=Thermodesulfovibrio yellowstonii TaxID=28262 RepID=RL29_THEYD|nr:MULTISPECIES: 50S ribosomal protein L29 [Thermodesulfovibrio]B5YG39.1 RecName: Full=Large ribosomal subunit protein uL29; AltName: Full=50S ribosomal protein L29 [Thermodesulfovibrio yellowstonii DSM 11347]ACI20233.1 ribosomal protein L29 [Thermodesulfovibrio yellowstonii DSM 11347]MDI6865930.1 50S ribosomal protein L29 [Thermodesulfovibrio yellowstonii]GLI53172.1 50S ribosomal protein L29 [Thermodesulfovibrio islandicus]
MKATELRNFSIEELRKKEKELRRELFNLRFQLAKGELQNVKRMKAVKKDIARILTIITEKTMMSSKGEAHKN